MVIDIKNKREDIFNTLQNLNKDAKPVFGLLRPQGMIEHLAFAISISNGSGPQKQYTTTEEADGIKGKIIYTEMELPQGIKNPIMGEVPPPLKFPDIQTAIAQLKKELDDFDKFYAANPDAKMIQPRMGPMDEKEWTILHNKHIAHHFRQFELI